MPIDNYADIDNYTDIDNNIGKNIKTIRYFCENKQGGTS